MSANSLIQVQIEVCSQFEGGYANKNQQEDIFYGANC